ncbi:MAG TPA: RagB/SusD family nutrient uptake outer membrane protein, partial [Flavitalea sp.]|nr:RagB/SusD family nutrient uptake outer membrane protein [Flavitalea sp.]
MKHIIYLILTIVTVFGTGSCNKDFMNLQPSDQFAGEAVWNDPALIQTFVNNIYLGLPHGFSNIMMSSIVDESMYNADFGTSNVTKSLVSPSDYSVFDEANGNANRQRGMNWSIVYKFVRAANLFFERSQTAPFTNEEQRNQMKGEVHFLRAYLYQNLVSMYGGVPIINKTYGLTGEFEVPRNSFEECVNFIVADLDTASMLLPLEMATTNRGRATKGA